MKENDPEAEEVDNTANKYWSLLRLLDHENLFNMVRISKDQQEYHFSVLRNEDVDL